MSEHTLSVRHLDKCGREGCNCLVDPGDSYCGEQCEHADSQAENSRRKEASPCACGHGDCKQLQSAANEDSVQRQAKAHVHGARKPTSPAGS